MIETLDKEERAGEVRKMFGDIAPSYDKANSILSGGMHHLWRRKAVRTLAPVQGARVLDVCCGTGDLSFALSDSVGDEGVVVGADFTPEMVALANEKKNRLRPDADLAFQVGDATNLAFETDSFDGATVAFGIRNVVDPVAGIREMARVVRPGGRVLVLEFGQPEGLIFGPLFRWYSRIVMPRIGGLLTGSREAYEYLPRTSANFPAGGDFVSEIFEPAGLRLVKARPLTFGIAWLYLGEVPQG